MLKPKLDPKNLCSSSHQLDPRLAYLLAFNISKKQNPLGFLFLRNLWKANETCYKGPDNICSISPQLTF